MKKKVKIVIIAIIVILQVLICNISVTAVSDTSVDNNFETGIVDITIKEYQNYNGVEEPLSSSISIMPGQYVSQIPRIKNNGSECYVRVKLDCELSEILSLININDGWKLYKDGYYYYSSSLKTSDSVDLFTGFKIPEDLSNEYQGINFSINISADAIQSTNFKPDWNKDSPWGQVEILANTKDEGYTINTVSKVTPLSIIYNGDVSDLVTNSDDFFINFETMMPGDTYSDSINFKNIYDRDIKIFFSQESEESDLLKQISLKISTKDKVIYSGTLSDAVNSIELLAIDKNGSDSVDFEIIVPAELNNDYSLVKERVKWVFSVDKSNSTGTSNVNSEYTNIISDLVKGTIKTGSIFYIGIVAVVMISAFFIVCIIRRRRNND